MSLNNLKEIQTSLSNIIKIINYVSYIDAFERSESDEIIKRLKTESNLLVSIPLTLVVTKDIKLICADIDEIKSSQDVRLDLILLISDTKIYIDACVKYCENGIVCPSIANDLENLKVMRRRCILF